MSSSFEAGSPHAEPLHAESPDADSPQAELRARITRELAQPVRPNVEWLAREIAAIHGDSVLGVLFYGSCLRKQTDEGVLDFWVVVDEYRTAYANGIHALLNRVAPPNVFYLEREHEGITLRTKYGVIDRRAFEKGTSLDAWHPYIWARFAQPARVIAPRDEAARQFFTATVSNAIVTLVGRLTCLMRERKGLYRFSLSAFWQEAFRRTYDSERRPEAEQLIRDLYFEHEDRYNAVAGCAMLILAEQGHFESATEHPRAFSVVISSSKLRTQRRRWALMRPFARSLGLVRLLKTAYTFGDWVPYVLWKLERHTGRRIELSARQRKHPLIFGWPVILPLLRGRNLR